MPLRKSQARRRKPKKTAERQRWIALPKLPSIDWGMLFNVVLLAGVLAGVYQATLWALDQPIHSVRIESRFERVSTPQVEAALDRFVQQGFLSVNLDDVRAELETLPWVARASVRRIWPSALSIRIVEQRAVARWGDHGLLNMDGELFVKEASHVPSELPRLDGPGGSEALVARRFFELNRRLQQRGLSAVALRLDARGAWELETSTGVQVRLGADELDARAERFFAALDSVLQSLTGNIEYVDMRYSNGFAVGWKSVDRVRLSRNGEGRPRA